MGFKGKVVVPPPGVCWIVQPLLHIKYTHRPLSSQVFNSSLMHISNQSITWLQLDAFRHVDMGQDNLLKFKSSIRMGKNVNLGTVAERAQRAAKRKNACKLRKQLHQFDNIRAANAHNTNK